MDVIPLRLKEWIPVRLSIACQTIVVLKQTQRQVLRMLYDEGWFRAGSKNVYICRVFEIDDETSMRPSPSGVRILSRPGTSQPIAPQLHQIVLNGPISVKVHIVFMQELAGHESRFGFGGEDWFSKMPVLARFLCYA
jgi:hypothetical protein